MWSENSFQWTILEPLCYSSFVFATLVHGVRGYKFCWSIKEHQLDINQLRHQLGTNHLTYIFKPHLSPFIVIFSTLTSSHHFFQYHLSPLIIFILCLFSNHCLIDIILVLPWVMVFHTSLHGGLSHSFPPFTPWAVVQRS